MKGLIAFILVMSYKLIKWAVEEILSRRREKIWRELKEDPNAIVIIED